MNILITGGTGFIGSRLALKCLERGDRVVVLGQENTDAEKHNKKLIEDKGATVVLGSVTDNGVLAEVNSGIDTVFHEGADFSGMSEERGFCVDSLLHNTYISVDRYGTEAAATQMAMMLGIGEEPEKGISLKLEHPFLFVIADEASGVILFFGKVLNPA